MFFPQINVKSQGTASVYLIYINDLKVGFRVIADRKVSCLCTTTLHNTGLIVMSILRGPISQVHYD